MKSFDYNKRVWGFETASLSPFDWGSLKLKYCLGSLQKITGKVLEVGCGGGQFAKGVHYYRPDLRIIGVDISNKSILYAKKTSHGVTFKYGDAFRLPFKANLFNAVLSFDTIEHLEKPKKALSEIRRVLKPGGVFHSSTPIEGSVYTILGIFYRIFRFNPKNKRIGHVNNFNENSLRKLIEEQGFKITETRYSTHLFSQFIDLIYSIILNARDTTRKNPDFSVEGYLFDKQGHLFFRLIRLLYSGIVFVGFLESRILWWFPGQAISITAIKK